ncbi:MAG: PAS domain-containing protein [Treponema sp.]|jgi:two-component system phosphate regulon sensor histidine kinase PhoR|nr:PAS domain-containing protein [Treponema sp.]
MRRRILLFASALAGFSILLTAVLVHFAVYWDYAELMKRDIAIEAEYIRAALELSGERYLDSLAPAARRAGGPFSRITLIDPGGRVLFETDAGAESMENHRSRREVAEAIRTGSGSETRFSETVGKQTYYYAVRLGGGSVLRLAKTTDSIFVSLIRPIVITVIIAVFIFGLAAAISSFVTAMLVAPINRLNLDAPETNVSYEELTPLLSRMKKQNDMIEAQLLEQRKKRLEFTAITDNMREGLIVLDEEAQVLSCNKSARNLLGIQPQSIENRNALVIRRDEAFRLLVEKASSGAASETTLPTGERHLRVFASPVLDGETVLGAVLVILDVTEQEDRERLRREFSANVSHELKTPLMAISGYAEIMAEGLVKPEDTRHFARNIYAEARRLVTLIGDIITLSHLDEKNEPLLTEETDLLPLTQKVLGRMGGAASERGISVTLDGESAVVSGSPGVLEEMIYNLLDNAVKYNREGGGIQVSLKKIGEGGPAGGRALLAVSDTGPGIPAAEQERIFERFYRVDKSRSKNAGGTGLGLSIVKHAAALHNAKVEVQSDGKSGSCFTVRFL